MDGGWALKHGVIGGIIAGIVFALAEMIFVWLMQGNALMPLHMIASIPLQQQPTEIAPTTAIVVGTLFHMLYAMVAAVIIAYIVAVVSALRNSRAGTVIFATVVGFLLWPLNFYLIAPNINVPWFATQTAPVPQAIWHALFGLVLGLYLASQLPRAEVVETRRPRATSARQT